MRRTLLRKYRTLYDTDGLSVRARPHTHTHSKLHYTFIRLYIKKCSHKTPSVDGRADWQVQIKTYTVLLKLSSFTSEAQNRLLDVYKRQNLLKAQKRCVMLTVCYVTTVS